MMSGFSFLDMMPTQIVAAIHTYGLAPSTNLRAEDIPDPHPDLLPAIFSAFLAPMGFDAVLALDNPKHHIEAIQVLHIHCLLKSIQFPGEYFHNIDR
uniref:Uncharacterized protein n=1 Tax=Oryza nivara TaxID=4536 RepID=A0A0E0IHA3_ORYNI